MDRAFADFLGSFANALAAVAALAALCAAVVEASDPSKPEISPAVPYLAALGIVIYLAAGVLKYLVVGG